MASQDAARAGVEAARRFVEDDEFAAAFEAELKSQYERLKTRLDRVSAALSHNHMGLAQSHESAPLNIDAVLRLIEAADQTGVSRGEIAVEMSVDASDHRLTKVLRHLRETDLVELIGDRRASRYRALKSTAAKQASSRKQRTPSSRTRT